MGDNEVNERWVYETNIKRSSLGPLNIRIYLCRISAGVPPESGKGQQCLSPVSTHRSGIDQVTLFRKKCRDVGQGFRRDPVDGCEAVLDVLHPPEYSWHSRDRIVDLGTDQMLELAFAVVTLPEPA